MASQFARYLFVGLAVFGAATATATAQKRLKLDKKYESDAWGYEIQPIQGWNSMPADQDDRYTVGRWKFDVTELEKRGDYEGSAKGTYCELTIVRIQPDVVTGDGKEPAKPSNISEALLKKLKPKNMEEWIDANWENASKRWLKKPFKGKMTGEIADFGTGQSHLTIATFEHMAVEWAVIYRCHEEDYNKTWSDIYEKSLKTFKVVKNVDPDAAAANRKDISKLKGEEKREALHQSIASSPGWFYIDTEHYVFLSNADRNFVKKLGEDLETVRKKLYVPNFPPRNKEVPLNPVRVFKTQKEYHQFGGPGSSAGYFSPAKGELVLFQEFENQSKTKSEDDCRAVMFHEGLHQYVHFAVGDVSPHSWFNEGHGDYFAGLNVSGSRTSVKTFDWRVGYLKQHLQGGNDLIPVRTLIRLPQSEYYSNAGLKYSQGWALIYFLREVSKDKSHADILSTYFEYLADNVTAFRAKKKKDGEDDDFGGESVQGIPGIRLIDFEDREKVEQILSEAVDKAFANVDLEALDVELRKFIEKL